MDAEERLEVLRDFTALEERTLETKGAEYASEEDTLSNFKMIANLLNRAMPLQVKCPHCDEEVGFLITPQHVLAIYLMKHILSILDYAGRGRVLSESIKERVLDIRVYAMLLYCLEQGARDGGERGDK
jgi:hypothetical protein